MSRIAVIGLGIMGLPMATNLVKAGYEVKGFNRSPGRMSMFAERGGVPATSIVDAVTSAEAIITMVPDSPDVESIVLGADGIFAHARAGTLWIDTSTIRPDVAGDLAQRARRSGLRPLDAPVSGGEQGAIDGALSVMVGGETTDFEAALPLLECVGRTVVHVGPSGAGQTVKAANQLIVAANIQALAEAIVFLEAYGVDRGAALRVLGGGLAGSKVLDQKGEKMLVRDFEPGFRLSLHRKDLGIVQAAAREAGVVIPLGSLVGQLVDAAVQRGGGGLDHSALLSLALDLSGRGA